MKLRMNMADYLVTLGMNNERVVSPLVSLDFCGPQTAHDGLKGMLR
jgi:4,5-dihydroxyphthalate decarboxylase